MLSWCILSKSIFLTQPFLSSLHCRCWRNQRVVSKEEEETALDGSHGKMPSGSVHRTARITRTTTDTVVNSTGVASLETSTRRQRRRRSCCRVQQCRQGLATALQATVVGSVFLVLVVLQLLTPPVTGQSNPPQTCPQAGEISPCQCQVKKNGLDILCEATDVQHITRAMSALKGKNPIIFYLKLRHNNLPKLQGFVFLSLDIRHLTIHNSSLAAIEETSLSSLGR